MKQPRSPGLPGVKSPTVWKDPVALFLVALGAAGFFLGHPNPVVHIPLAGLLCPAVVFLLGTRAVSFRQAFLTSWAAASAGLSAALYWIYVPVSTVGELPLILAVPCVLALGMYLACYYGLAGLLIYDLAAFRDVPGLSSAVGRRSLRGPLCFSLCCGLLYGGCEILAGVLFTGFPWLPLATGFFSWPAWIQAASLVGNNGQSALMAVAACILALSLGSGGKAHARPAVLGLALLLAFPLYGVWRLHNVDDPANISRSTAPDPSLVIGMVQGNIDQTQKWDPAFQRATVAHYLEMSDDLLRRQREHSPFRSIDLLLWPETAMPFYFEDSGLHTEQLRAFARENRVNIGFGTLGYSREPGGDIRFYNRFQTITDQGMISRGYDKVHLVPFGEYIPLRLDIAFLNNILQGTGFSAGDSVSAIPLKVGDPLADKGTKRGEETAATTGRVVSLGVLICYEAIFPDLARQQVASGASLLVNVSNDAWFGKTSAPMQHLGLAAMRAVEQQRYLVRSTNTGYSALIDPYGRIVDRGSLFAAETFLVKAPPLHMLTLYHHIGPWIDALLLLFLGATTVFCFLRTRRPKKVLL